MEYKNGKYWQLRLKIHCHRKNWPEPEYVVQKHGEERFTAITTIEGKNFRSSERASEQEAREDAAMQGFSHFTEQTPPTT
ncbi:hypothetical protein OnM2_092052 [Erysiphe neolycopersici]|uniref:Uncharacterized protein n=1 Tax=Erysiphe neolycopersici TaxID=212602 RepID=A0A420HC82_9PEZI|nr:hypothetical protein OnM2_092052 [Erysiphe neolycopersici]